MWTDLKKAWIVTRREIKDQFRDWRIIAPIIILTVFFPGLMNFTAQQAVDFVVNHSNPHVQVHSGPVDPVPADGGGLFPDLGFSGDCPGKFCGREGAAKH